MQVLRHNTSMPNEKKWLRKSYLGDAVEHALDLVLLGFVVGTTWV